MKKILLVTILNIVVLTGFSQKVRLVAGSLLPVKGQRVILTEFNYDNMVISKDEIPEQDYVKRKKRDYDAKEPGRGDKWEKAWIADRKTRFEPKFNELFSKHANVAIAGESKYKLIFKTIMTEPGWNVGMVRVPARINAEAFIVEIDNPSNVIARFTIMNAPGRDAAGFDYDTGYRLQEAYAKSGKEIGQLIAKAK